MGGPRGKEVLSTFSLDFFLPAGAPYSIILKFQGGERISPIPICSPLHSMSLSAGLRNVLCFNLNWPTCHLSLVIFCSETSILKIWVNVAV